MSDLTTVDNVKEYLRVKSTSIDDDALFARLITSCSTEFESWLNRKLGVQTYTDKFSGSNNYYHVIPNYPVQSISSVSIDGVNITDYDFDDTEIYLKNSSFTKGRSNCLITYTAGFDPIPNDIEQACIELVSIKYKSSAHLDVSSQSAAGATTAYIVKDLPDFVKVVLNQYKKVAMI